MRVGGAHASVGLGSSSPPLSLQIGFGSVAVAEDFVVSGFKITGIVENKSGKHSLADIGLLLHREDGGASLSLSSPRAACLRVDARRLSGLAGSLGRL